MFRTLPRQPSPRPVLLHDVFFAANPRRALAPQMSSSRNHPFSFSPEIREILGPPSRIKAEARATYPALFDSTIADRLTYVNDNCLGPCVMMRWVPQTLIPAGTPVGIFSCLVIGTAGSPPSQLTASTCKCLWDARPPHPFQPSLHETHPPLGSLDERCMESI